jgi:hypothetical protein
MFWSVINKKDDRERLQGALRLSIAATVINIPAMAGPTMENRGIGLLLSCFLQPIKRDASPDNSSYAQALPMPKEQVLEPDCWGCS